MHSTRFTSRILLTCLFANIFQYTHARPLSKTAQLAQKPLYLTPINTAAFVFYVVFAIATFFQLYNALRGLSRDKKREAKVPHYRISTGIKFRSLLVFATLPLITHYTLTAISIAYDLNRIASRVSFSFAYYAMRIFTGMLADVIIAGAMLVLVHHRARVSRVPAAPLWKKIMDAALILLLTLYAIVVAVIGATYATMENRLSMLNIREIFYHMFTAFYILVVIDIFISAALISYKLSKDDVEDNIIRRFLRSIAPLLLLCSKFKLVDDILLSLPVTVNSLNSIDYDALRLARAIVLGFINFFILYIALDFSEPNPKRYNFDDRQMKERYELRLKDTK
ncbi:hypothetical protein BDQ12DRAFT_738306 [Crucibulum laeve]|uniref:Uncharacterized protein n=1 Tax=Crucibulum laeve TaxID=68775 RepID=A0A5C3LM53_9AGAR|nr:hypothetical protein BDQ12DRAFT_738306 [Crucibulum laeve]